MRATFHHPYYLPWLGYFAKLDVCDVLVVLDTALFRRNHIKRVKIVGTRGEPEWLTLPVGNNWAVPCNGVVLPDLASHTEKVLRTFSLAYGRAEHFEAGVEYVEQVYRSSYVPGRTIVEANVTAVATLRALWSAPKVRVVLASEYSGSADRDERLIEVCTALGIDEVVAGDGSMLRVHDLDRIRRAGIRLLHYPYFTHHPTYPQAQRKRSGGGFVPGLSAVDAIFNVGFERIPELLRPRSLRLEPVI